MRQKVQQEAHPRARCAAIARQAREAAPRLRCLLMTGVDLRAELPGVRHLLKPLSIEAVLQALAEAR